jgi:hypothetical protein
MVNDVGAPGLRKGNWVLQIRRNRGAQGHNRLKKAKPTANRRNSPSNTGFQADQG